MFPVDLDPTFTVEGVQLTVPGRAEPVVVSLTFAHLTPAQRDEFDVQFKDRSVREALAHLIRGWTGFSKPFSAEALDAVLANYPMTASEMWRTYRDEMTASKRKN